MNKTSMMASMKEREKRVVFLAVSIAVLGMIDLAITMHYMSTTGMPEANPIARYLVGVSPGLLVMYKVAITAFVSGVLIALAKHRSAEIGSWIGLVVMLALTIHWAAYVNADLNGEIFAPMQGELPVGWTSTWRQS